MDSARIRSITPLLYDEGPDPDLDRPAHVRAASGIAWAETREGPRLCVCQDDAHFLALIDPQSHRVSSLALPIGPGGRRQFDTLRKNKMDKLDVESACVVPTASGPRLWLVGSGSAPVREVLVELDLVGSQGVRIRSTSAFCARLREHAALIGAELNLEGACVVGRDLVLLQRGNGAGARNAVIRVALEELEALLAGGSDPLRTLRVDPVVLPELEGVGLSFTDACLLERDRLLFLAAAEASPNAIDDGVVVGCVLGIASLASCPALDSLLPILEPDGRPSRRKPEGVVLDPQRPNIAYVVVDRDDPKQASELLEVELPSDLAMARPRPSPSSRAVLPRESSR